jgi:hypothetical protein
MCVPFSRVREKVSAQPTDEGLSLGMRLRLALTPTLSRARERGRKGAT